MSSSAQPKKAVGDQDPRAWVLAQLESRELDLPVVPEAATSVLEACRDEGSGPRQVSEIMERDPSLAAHVLRIANSAAYGGSESVTSLPQAIGRLGLKIISQITMAVVVKGQVFNVGRFDSLIRVLWIHSAATALWSREIARARRQDGDPAFLCGLIHNVGHPVVLRALVRLEPSLGRKLADEEMAAIAEDLHTVVGAELARRWAFPEWMADAIAWHHDWESAPRHRAEAAATAFADQLAHWSLDEGQDEVVGSLAMLTELGMGPGDLERMMDVGAGVRGGAEAFV